MPNPILADILNELVGKTIQTITNEPFYTDGGGPCCVAIHFTDGTAIDFDVEELKAVFPNSSIRHWWNKERFKVHQDVMRSMRD